MRLPPLSRLVPLLVLPLAGGCAAFQQWFPRHEDVFKPVPLTIGEPRVVDGDTAYVLRGAGYELVAPRRELIPDTRDELDRVSRQFVRMFEVEPPPIVVSLFDSLPRRAPAADTAALPLGPRVIPVLIPRPPRPRRGDPNPRLRVPVAGPVARGWFAAYVDTRYAADRGSAPDTAPRPPLPYRAGEDPRLPDWLETGVAAVLIGSPAQELRIAQLAEQLERRPENVMPLRQLFSANRPRRARPDSARAERDARRDRRGEMEGPEDVADDPALAPEPGMRRARRGRPTAEMEAAARFAVQSYAVTQFFADREGPAFVGRIVDRLLDGATIADVLQRDTRTVPDDIDQLDADWRRWLRERAPRR
jgi:hypothetical protein